MADQIATAPGELELDCWARVWRRPPLVIWWRLSSSRCLLLWAAGLSG